MTRPWASASMNRLSVTSSQQLGGQAAVVQGGANHVEEVGRLELPHGDVDGHAHRLAAVGAQRRRVPAG